MQGRLPLIFPPLSPFRLTVQYFVKIAFHGLQFPDVLFLLPVLVIKGVFLFGKLLNLRLYGLGSWQFGNAICLEIPGGRFGNDKLAFVMLPVGSLGFLCFLCFQPVTGGFGLDVG